MIKSHGDMASHYSDSYRYRDRFVIPGIWAKGVNDAVNGEMERRGYKTDHEGRLLKRGDMLLYKFISSFRVMRVIADREIPFRYYVPGDVYEVQSDLKLFEAHVRSIAENILSQAGVSRAPGLFFGEVTECKVLPKNDGKPFLATFDFTYCYGSKSFGLVDRAMEEIRQCHERGLSVDHIQKRVEDLLEDEEEGYGRENRSWGPGVSVLGAGRART